MKNIVNLPIPVIKALRKIGQDINDGKSARDVAGLGVINCFRDCPTEFGVGDFLFFS